MTETFLVAIDQGTTSSRSILFSVKGEPLHTSQKELTQYYPHSGWVEQDATEIWEDTLATTREVIEHAGGAEKIAAIGITNQRETTVLWDKDTLKPLCKAIVWQDRRTADYCASLKKKGLEDMISSKTGLLIDPYFSCTKIKWAIDNIPEVAQAASHKKLAFGTIDSFLLMNLTGGKVHATDVTNASRTGLFNIATLDWDDDLLELYDIPRDILPEVKDNVGLFGKTDPSLFGEEIEIGGMAGDQHAALVGQCCFKKGMIKSTYGTGCFALLNTGEDFIRSKNRLLSSIGYRINGQTTYVLEGSIFIAGAVIQWLRDELGVIDTSAQSEALATSVPDNNGVYFIPAFTGLGAPHWQPDARAAIMGLSRGTGKAHITRAALEAQAYQTYDLLGAMEKDSGIRPERLRVDGGLVANNFMCQFLADILRVDIDVPRVPETTALGAAFLAGLHAGIYKDLDSLSDIWHAEKDYAPHMPRAEAVRLSHEWQNYLNKLL